MAITKSQKKVLARLVADHDGLDVIPARGVGRSDRSVAYPIERGGRVGWWRQVAAQSEPRESGRRYHYAAVIRSRRPSNAAEIMRALS